MRGEPEPIYVRARSALLDALEALAPHLDAVVLVGAQAIYCHTGDADLAVAAYTTDADLGISPDVADQPLLADLLASKGFTPRDQPGGWRSADGIYLDLMLPDGLAGPGRRGARLGAHGKHAARRAKGLERVLVDRARTTISALDPADSRVVSMWVAGAAALLVAKIHKIAERVDAADRVRDKDALDVLRLLRSVDTELLAARLRSLRASEIAGAVTIAAIGWLPKLFGQPDAVAVQMAVRAAGDAEDPATIAASTVALVGDLLAALA